MSDRRKRWIIDVHEQETGDRYLYGPYTESQARRTVEQADRYYAKEYDDPNEFPPIVSCYPLGQWSP